MAEEKKVQKEFSLKAKLLALILCPLIVIALASVAVVLTAKTVVDAEQYEFDDGTVQDFAVPETPDAVIDYLLNASEFSVSVRDVQVDCSKWASISDVDGSSLTSAQANMLGYLISDVASGVSGAYNAAGCKFGEDPSAFRVPGFSSSDAAAELSGDGKTVKITAQNDLTPEDVNALSDEFAGEALEYILSASTEECVIKDVRAVPSNVSITAEINVSDGKIKNVNTQKKYDCTVTLSFSGALEGLGGQTFTCVYTVTEKNTFTYAGIFISQDSVSMEKNGFVTLGISANVDEAAVDGEDFTIKFISSDDSVVKADENGMIEGLSESTEPVTVTVEMEYLGNTYTDECSVRVGTPVEKVTVSPSKKTAAPGEKFSFEARVKPDDATVKDVIWLSEDESVCTVDEKTGECTAVAPGDTRIIAVTVDGNYMSASEIIVEGGNENG